MYIDRDTEEDTMNNVLAALVLATWTLPVSAEPPSASVYQSTTADYISYREAAIADWRAVNDEMAELGGHMGHMGHMGHQNDQPREHDIHPAQTAPEGMGSHQHSMGVKP